jgi:hypothetical protein
MAHVIMDHRVSWCLGTSLAPDFLPTGGLTELGKVMEHGRWFALIRCQQVWKRKTNPGSFLSNH